MRLRGDGLRGPPRLHPHPVRRGRDPDRRWAALAAPEVPDAPPAVADIPADYLALYRDAAARFGLDWPVLAAVGRVETNHGRNRNGCDPNYAGARGPMQFLEPTFVHAAKLAGLTDPDICDPADAIPAAAAYLKSNGAPDRLAARPLPLQPGRLVPAARHGLGRALRLRRPRRLAGRGRPDQPGLRADLVRPRAGRLLRGQVLPALPRRDRHRGAARHAGPGDRRGPGDDRRPDVRRRGRRRDRARARRLLPLRPPPARPPRPRRPVGLGRRPRSARSA